MMTKAKVRKFLFFNLFFSMLKLCCFSRKRYLKEKYKNFFFWKKSMNKKLKKKTKKKVKE